MKFSGDFRSLRRLGFFRALGISIYRAWLRVQLALPFELPVVVILVFLALALFAAGFWVGRKF